MLAEDRERRDDAKRGRERHGEELLRLVHVEAPLAGAAAPEAAAHQVRTAYAQILSADKRPECLAGIQTFAPARPERRLPRSVSPAPVIPGQAAP